MTRNRETKPSRSITPAELARSLNIELGQTGITTADRIVSEGKTPPRKTPMEDSSPSYADGISVRVEFYDGGASHGSMPVSLLEDLPRAAAGLFPEHLEGKDDPSGLVFLDTETTGIGESSMAFLVGLGRIRRGKGFEVTQLFLESKKNEPNLLDVLSGYFSEGDVIVTYNGEYFDMPLLRRRYLLHGRPFTPGGLPHLDLLKPARSIWGGMAPNCRLKTLETEVFGFSRAGDVEGREIPVIYRDFLRTGRTGALTDVFVHNALDIISLAALMRSAAGNHAGVRAVAVRKAGSAAGRGRTASKVLSGADKRRELKKLLLLHKKNGDHTAALETAELLMAGDTDGDPRPYLEAAAIHDSVFGDPEKAASIIETALRTPRIPKDRETLEKRLLKLRNKLGMK